MRTPSSDQEERKQKQQAPVRVQFGSSTPKSEDGWDTCDVDFDKEGAQKIKLNVPVKQEHTKKQDRQDSERKEADMKENKESDSEKNGNGDYHETNNVKDFIKSFIARVFSRGPLRFIGELINLTDFPAQLRSHLQQPLAKMFLFVIFIQVLAMLLLTTTLIGMVLCQLLAGVHAPTACESSPQTIHYHTHNYFFDDDDYKHFLKTNNFPHHEGKEEDVIHQHNYFHKSKSEHNDDEEEEDCHEKNTCGSEPESPEAHGDNKERQPYRYTHKDVHEDAAEEDVEETSFHHGNKNHGNRRKHRKGHNQRNRGRNGEDGQHPKNKNKNKHKHKNSRN
eukprot:m.38193 g.38193  ORF g.38193 m.38193 type:complete len:335 (-) comp9401_c0_seq1:137-1141(-)